MKNKTRKNKFKKNYSFKKDLIPQEIFLTHEDRITYLYKRNSNKEITEVTNVSYEIFIDDEWITIVRYDSSHGELHCHRRVSLEDPQDTPTTLGVKKKGSHNNWLTWAINDIKERFEDYKRGFLKRSKIIDKI